jgi:HlyD family secretion protein
MTPLLQAQELAVASLGRIEPHNGVLRLAGPSGGGGIGGVIVIRELAVREGDWVEKGAIVATLDSYAVREAQVARLEAIVKNAEAELERQSNLSNTSATSRAKLDDAAMNLEVARADLVAARAQLDMALVRAPMSGQVIKIHAYPGERVGADGILELAKTDRMYAVAEVYETDINRVRPGQRATVTAPALADPLTGTVERIALQVGRMDVLGTDPIAKTDARVVEVFILLDDSPAVAALTNMQVEVLINDR